MSLNRLNLYGIAKSDKLKRVDILTFVTIDLLLCGLLFVCYFSCLPPCLRMTYLTVR